jgi:hypothetical protein
MLLTKTNWTTSKYEFSNTIQIFYIGTDSDPVSDMDQHASQFASGSGKITRIRSDLDPQQCTSDEF